MNTLAQQLKNLAVDGKISLEKALKLIAPIDQEREETKTLLRKLEKDVGMVPGEMINIHIANMDGVKFNTTAYHYEKPVGDQ